MKTAPTCPSFYAACSRVLMAATTVNQVAGSAIAPAALRRISWGAVFAGAIVALAVELMLMILGVGVGASTLHPGAGTEQMSSLGIGAGIWFVVSALISVYVGGWVAGKLAGIPTRSIGALHGFITWALAMLTLFYLLTTTIGAVAGGAASLLTNAAGIAAKGVGAAAPASANAAGVTPQDVRNQADDIVNDPRFQTVVGDIVRTGKVSPQDHQALASLVAQHQNVSQQQADNEVTHWEQTIQQDAQAAKNKANGVADVAAGDTASAGIWTFVMLILALICGCIGGAVGAPENSTLVPISVRPLRQ